MLIRLLRKHTNFIRIHKATRKFKKSGILKCVTHSSYATFHNWSSLEKLFKTIIAFKGFIALIEILEILFLSHLLNYGGKISTNELIYRLEYINISL